MKGWLKRAGDWLESADDKTTNTDLQTLTSEVSKAAGDAIKAAKQDAASKVQDLGIVDGFNELAGQITGDLKGVGGSREASTPTGSDNKASDRLADLRERVQELEQREDERSRNRESIQSRFQEIDAELKKLQESLPEVVDGSDAVAEHVCQPGSQTEALDSEQQAGASNERLEAMRKEFCALQASAEERLKVLQGELSEAAAACDPLEAEHSFFKEKAQRMLKARGLAEVPEDMRRRLEASGNDDANSQADPASAHVAEEEDERSAREEHERLMEERAAQQRVYERLEKNLADVMRDSDAAMERASEQRRLERELDTARAAAEAKANSEVVAADSAMRRAHIADDAKQQVQQRCEYELQRVHEEARNGGQRSNGAAGQVPSLRQEAEEMRRKIEEMSQENRNLEGRLQKSRAAAAADLERAVPLSSGGCWQNVDGPVLKAVTLLVRSTCLRRTFAIHLLGTYAWLFFLLFWLERSG